MPLSGPTPITWDVMGALKSYVMPAPPLSHLFPAACSGGGWGEDGNLPLKRGLHAINRLRSQTGLEFQLSGLEQDV